MVAFLMLLPSCCTNSHLGSTPYLDRDLLISPDEMSRTFYDVDRYEEVTFPFFAFFDMPPVTELKYPNRFGPFAKKRLSWWSTCPFFVFPLPLCPSKVMTWRRGNYRIEAVVIYPMIFGYKPHIWYWDVEEIKERSIYIQTIPQE